ncbi:hypothetical protein MHA_0744 [Mannheimia haemolytica PHL213]|nr:hypothetical protein MHA_0744 [Mannheimia haemolytica PHL213]
MPPDFDKNSTKTPVTVFWVRVDLPPLFLTSLTPTKNNLVKNCGI